LRSDTVLKHKLGTDTAEDEVVYFEKDDTLMLQLVKKNQNIFLISSSSTLTTEFMTLLADNPDGEFKVFRNEKEV
jgi:oligopeptidase B